MQKRLISEKHKVFGFPESQPDLCEKWIKFVNRKSRVPCKDIGICAKHFSSNYLKTGKQITLSTIYSQTQDKPASLLPSPSTSRKPPTERIVVLPDGSTSFKQKDVKDFKVAIYPE